MKEIATISIGIGNIQQRPWPQVLRVHETGRGRNPWHQGVGVWIFGAVNAGICEEFGLDGMKKTVIILSNESVAEQIQEKGEQP